MTRRRVLILAAIVAALLLAADFHDLFVLPSLRRLWPWLGDVCGWLTKPIPMALVTLGASLALPRDGARLPVVVNLAAALLLGMALERLPGARGFALLRLTPNTAQAMSTVCFYGFLLWVACRCCAPRRAARSAYGAACRGRSVGGGTGASRWTALSFGGASHGGDNGGLPVAFDGPCTTPCCESRSLTRIKRAPSERSLPFERRFL